MKEKLFFLLQLLSSLEQEINIDGFSSQKVSKIQKEIDKIILDLECQI